MTGKICEQADDCVFYEAVYGSGTNNAVIDMDKKLYTCDALTTFMEYVSSGSAKLSESSLNLLRTNPLECVVLENLNQKS